MLVDPSQHLLRQGDCPLLLAGQHRRVGGPPQDLKPVERQLVGRSSDAIPDLERALVVQPRIRERAKLLCRGPGADRGGERLRHLPRRVPVVGELRGAGGLRSREVGMLAQRPGEPQMVASPLAGQQVCIDRFS